MNGTATAVDYMVLEEMIEKLGPEQVRAMMKEIVENPTPVET